MASVNHGSCFLKREAQLILQLPAAKDSCRLATKCRGNPLVRKYRRWLLPNGRRPSRKSLIVGRRRISAGRPFPRIPVQYYALGPIEEIIAAARRVHCPIRDSARSRGLPLSTASVKRLFSRVPYRFATRRFEQRDIVRRVRFVESFRTHTQESNKLSFTKAGNPVVPTPLVLVHPWFGFTFERAKFRDFASRSRLLSIRELYLRRVGRSRWHEQG